VHQHLDDIDRTVDLNAPAPFDRTAPGQTRTVAAANATRPIVPVNGGVRQVSVLMNLGEADYDGLQTLLRYHGSRLEGSVSYTLSKATNTTEPDGNGIGPTRTTSRGWARSSAARASSTSATARSSPQLPAALRASPSAR
jgi:hypothetical protein